MTNKTLVYAVFSVLIPFMGYAFFLLAGSSPARLSQASGYLSLLIFNAMGLILSVLALAGSNPKPLNTSPRIRIIVLLGTIGLFANTIVFELVLLITVFRSSEF